MAPKLKRGGRKLKQETATEYENDDPELDQSRDSEGSPASSVDVEHDMYTSIRWPVEETDALGPLWLQLSSGSMAPAVLQVIGKGKGRLAQADLADGAFCWYESEQLYVGLVRPVTGGLSVRVEDENGQSVFDLVPNYDSDLWPLDPTPLPHRIARSVRFLRDDDFLSRSGIRKSLESLQCTGDGQASLAMRAPPGVLEAGLGQRQFTVTFADHTGELLRLPIIFAAKKKADRSDQELADDDVEGLNDVIAEIKARAKLKAHCKSEAVDLDFVDAASAPLVVPSSCRRMDLDVEVGAERAEFEESCRSSEASQGSTPTNERAHSTSSDEDRYHSEPMHMASASAGACPAPPPPIASFAGGPGAFPAAGGPSFPPPRPHFFACPPQPQRPVGAGFGPEPFGGPPRAQLPAAHVQRPDCSPLGPPPHMQPPMPSMTMESRGPPFAGRPEPEAFGFSAPKGGPFGFEFPSPGVPPAPPPMPSFPPPNFLPFPSQQPPMQPGFEPAPFGPAHAYAYGQAPAGMHMPPPNFTLPAPAFPPGAPVPHMQPPIQRELLPGPSGGPPSPAADFPPQPPPAYPPGPPPAFPPQAQPLAQPGAGPDPRAGRVGTFLAPVGLPRPGRGPPPGSPWRRASLPPLSR